MFFKPKLTESTFRHRLELAEKRLYSYPLDTLDFIMIDLEKPAGRTRHASQCTTDLTGRTIEFWSEAHSVLDKPDDTRLNELFRRVLLKGPHGGFVRRFIPYIQYTGNTEAMRTVKLQADAWADALEKGEHALDGICSTCDCYIEGLANLYEMLHDERYLKVARAIIPASLFPFEGSHSHGQMTVLRSLLRLAQVSGDMSYVDKVKEYIDKIRENQYPDGSISESFRRSFRTEGCSTADWIMLNLRYYEITHDETALNDAEHSLLNGLFFNQFVTGGFGHRSYTGVTGYGMNIEEAWWCCTQTGGLAIVHFARHAVELINGKIVIHYPVPGVYTLNRNGKEIRVTIVSEYPSLYEAAVTVEGGSDIPVSFRSPSYTKNMKVTSKVSADTPDKVFYCMTSDIGHYAEKRNDGYILKYGPLLLAPMHYDNLGEMINSGKEREDTINAGVPEGYIKESFAGTHFTLIAPSKEKTDKNGFWQIPGLDVRPEWTYFDDGAGSYTGTFNRAYAAIDVRNENGETMNMCFTPICYATSCLMLNPVPICFDLIIEEDNKNK